MDISTFEKNKTLNNYFKIDEKCSQVLVNEMVSNSAISHGFARLGIISVKDLLNFSINDLLSVRNIGPVKLNIILGFLDDLQTHKIDLNTLIESQNKKIKYNILIHKDDIFDGHFNCLDKKDKELYQQAYNLLGQDFVQWIQSNPTSARNMQRSLYTFRDKQNIYKTRRKILIHIIKIFPKEIIDSDFNEYISVYTNDELTRKIIESHSRAINSLYNERSIFEIIHSPDFSEIYKFLRWCTKNL